MFDPLAQLYDERMVLYQLE